MEWKVNTDGALLKNLRGAVIVVQSPDGSIIEQSIEICIRITNNQAKYEALIGTIKLSANLGARTISISSDSQLVVQQMNGEYNIKEPIISQYVEKAKKLI